MISPDLPIQNVSEDKLNRASFASGLADAIMEHSSASSFTIGLYGEWGSGKTSLINMVLDEIEKRKDNKIILRFNPWLCSETNQLISQFFKQLASVLKEYENKDGNKHRITKDSTWQLLDDYADYWCITSAIPVVGSAIEAFGSTFSKRIKKKNGDLQKRKNEIVDKLKKTGVRIIVSIDDIDRLSEDEIIAVFQLVKSLADFPNTVYLLSFDYNVVISALAKVQNGDGKEYLEKVIQVPFEIPAPDMDDIYRFLFMKLNDILDGISEDKWDTSAWNRLFLYGMKGYIHSIRDVIRFINVFSLKYDMVKNEVDPVDLLGITCLQVFEPIVYSRLPHHKGTLCGGLESYSINNHEQKNEEIRTMFDLLTSDSEGICNLDALKQVMVILFPRLSEALHTFNGSGRRYDHRSYLIRHRISVSECFDRYFSLRLEQKSISNESLEKYIFEASLDNLLSFIDVMANERKASSFISALDAYAHQKDHSPESITSERSKILIQALLIKWNTFQCDDEDFLLIPFTWRLVFCIEALYDRIPSIERYSHLTSLFENHSVHLSTISFVLMELEKQHGRFTDREAREQDAIITIDELERLEKIFVERAENTMNADIPIGSEYDLSYLRMLSKLDQEFVQCIQKKIITDNFALVAVISYCTEHGRYASNKTGKTWKPDMESLSAFITPEEAYDRMESFSKSNEFATISEEKRMDIVAFLLYKKHGIKDDDTFDFLTEKPIRKELGSRMNS